MSSNEVRVRAACPDDVAFIVDAIHGLAAYERLSAECRPSAERLREHLFGEPCYAQALVAEIDGARVGYALCFLTYSTFLTKPGVFVEDLFVQPEARGYGAGRALLEAVVESAKRRGCARVEWSVLDWNEPAIRFYRAFGARPQEEWTIYRLADAALTCLPERDDG